MRLLRLQYNGDYELVRYVGKHVPPYAILSHTWGRDDEEVAFSDIQNATYRNKPAFAKLQFCGEQAAKDNLEHFWVDTCCINKSSDAELSEALNSMFRWYRNATKCYVYLADVAVNRDSQQLPLELMDPESHQLPFESTFRQSRWFTRGWTLQELVAPSSVDFFSCEGIYIGNKRTLELPIYNITGIAIAALRGASLSNFSVAERISWAARRETTIEEDQVYCLLGIFDVHMPVIYGERVEHAMRRLRKEILETDRTSTLKEVYESDNPEACLSTLAAADQTRFLSQTLHRSKHACVWISSNRQYDVWYKDNDSSLLWITARAGCGKTTAAAHISQMVSAEQIKGQGSIEKAYKPVLLYFFFRRSNLKADKTALAALRTLTSQLVHQEARLLPILHRRHDELSAKGGFEWTWENLSSVLEEMLEQPMFTLPVYIVLDAIDECESDSRKLILDWAKGLVGAMTTSTFRAPNTIIKLLVTSRPDG
ncbi:HET-domain-containing protein, partial [Lentithecium fluviatile CBS 122367]